MEARLIADRRQWNAFVAASPTGHLCQTYEWAEHGEDVTARGRALHVGAVEGNQLLGAMLLLRHQQRGIPQALFYAPRGPVVDSPDSPALGVLLRGAARFARRAGGFVLRMEPNMPDADPRWERALRSLGCKPTNHVIYLRNTWILDIRPDEQALLAGMKMTWRYNIGYAQRKGVTVRPAATEEDFQTFIRLLSETARRERFYMYPTQVFRDMLAHYAPEAAARDGTAIITLLLAEYAGEIIGATTLATFGDTAYSLHTGLSDLPEHRKARPNYLMQFECMRRAKAAGCSYYDFRNIPEILQPGQPMYGVYEFKQGFGGAFWRAVPTMDLVLNPLVYYPYQLAVDLRRRRQDPPAAATRARDEHDGAAVAQVGDAE